MQEKKTFGWEIYFVRIYVTKKEEIRRESSIEKKGEWPTQASWKQMIRDGLETRQEWKGHTRINIERLNKHHAKTRSCPKKKHFEHFSDIEKELQGRDNERKGLIIAQPRHTRKGAEPLPRGGEKELQVPGEKENQYKFRKE